jgi:hypothetical protein
VLLPFVLLYTVLLAHGSTTARSIRKSAENHQGRFSMTVNVRDDLSGNK